MNDAIDHPDALPHEPYEACANVREQGLDCTRCDNSAARSRDGYEFGPLCDGCAARTAVWECPGCGCTIIGHVKHVGDICTSCRAQPEWEALPQEFRDEIGAMVDAGKLIPSIYRLMELDGHTRPSIDYMRMVSYRGSLRDGRGSRSSVEL